MPRSASLTSMTVGKHARMIYILDKIRHRPPIIAWNPSVQRESAWGDLAERTPQTSPQTSPHIPVFMGWTVQSDFQLMSASRISLCNAKGVRHAPESTLNGETIGESFGETIRQGLPMAKPFATGHFRYMMGRRWVISRITPFGASIPLVWSLQTVGKLYTYAR